MLLTAKNRTAPRTAATSPSRRSPIPVYPIRCKEWGPRYPWINKKVCSLRFDAFMGLLIVLNAICIGWDTYYDAGDERPALLATSEHLFTFIFGATGKSAQSRAPSSIHISSSFGSHDTTQPGRLFAQSIVATAARTAGGKDACSATDHARTRCR